MRTVALAPRQKITLTSAATGVLIVLLLVFITYPSIKEIRSLNASIDAERIELEAQYVRGQTLKQTLKTYQEVKPNVGELDRVYLKRGQELAFITALEGTADSVHINQQLKLNSPDPQKQNELPIELTLSGELPNIIRYLAGLEALDYYIDINTIRLGQPEFTNNDSSLSKLNALLTATAFIKP